MKYAAVLLSCLLISATLSAQATRDPDAPYKKDPKLPAFKILQTDSSWFTKEQVPRQYDYTAVIYFAPDCGHCQYTVGELVKHMDSLKNVFFVMAAYKSLAEIRQFYNHYNLAVYPNIRMGRDPEYAIPSFYRVESTPFVAVYDKKGILIKVYDPPHNPVMEVSQLVELVNKK